MNHKGGNQILKKCHFLYTCTNTDACYWCHWHVTFVLVLAKKPML